MKTNNFQNEALLPFPPSPTSRRRASIPGWRTSCRRRRQTSWAAGQPGIDLMN
jgi:hypothetical protein